ncbi:Spermidine/putrescine import ATP-binding protein PotA [Folsomia candida]|uniref:Spermidine/putrescine import ATP-binding protein PotA n=1 Tax=Folsomia candida TaxID=158441 RepID=A0A226DUT8_FOLCA|nr:Spermidine/putrescine import ATP-binding protein PotA [Folsomia candida]
MAAVEVRNGWKSYSKGNFILNNFNMQVGRGEIYALLGASGCGKTTLMSIIVGLRHLDSGDLTVFGRQRNGYLGHLCGYMPQLYDFLETQFQGQLSGGKPFLSESLNSIEIRVKVKTSRIEFFTTTKSPLHVIRTRRGRRSKSKDVPKQQFSLTFRSITMTKSEIQKTFHINSGHDHPPKLEKHL